MPSASHPSRSTGFRYIAMLALVVVCWPLPAAPWLVGAICAWALGCDLLLRALVAAKRIPLLLHALEAALLAALLWLQPVSLILIVTLGLAFVAAGAAQYGRLGLMVHGLAFGSFLLSWIHRRAPPMPTLDELAALVLLGTFAIGFALVGFARVQRLHLRSRWQHQLIARLARYLPASVAVRLASSPNAPMALQRCWLMIVFVDLHRFTAACSELPAAQLAQLLNGFYIHLQQGCDAQGATLCKVLGDGALIVWDEQGGVTRAQLARHAVLLVQDLQSRCGALLARESVRLDLRSAVACGECLYGDWGGERLHHTVLGPSVNLAARLQHRAKPGGALLSAGAAQLLPELKRLRRRRLRLSGFGWLDAYEM